MIRKNKWGIVFLLGCLLLFFYCGYRIRCFSYEFVSSLTQQKEIKPIISVVGQNLRKAVSEKALREDVSILASDEFKGRKPMTEGGKKAQNFLTERFQSLKLSPLFEGQYQQAVLKNPKEKTREQIGTNIGGMIKASNPKASAVLLIAHYDHEGEKEGHIHNGADDNASSVAILLEIARLCQQKSFSFPNHLVFLCVDNEEPPWVRTENMGSSYFANFGPFPAEKIRCAVVLDVMGGSGIEALSELFFVLGAETSPQLAELVSQTPQPEKEASYKMMSVAMVEGRPWDIGARKAKSDYFQFRNKGIPFLFLTAGTTAKYHTAQDTFETLNYPKMASECGFIADLLVRIGNSKTDFTFNGQAVDLAQDLRMGAHLLEGCLQSNFPTYAKKIMQQDQLWLKKTQQEFEKKKTISLRKYCQLLEVALRAQLIITRPDWEWALFILNALNNYDWFVLLMGIFFMFIGAIRWRKSYQTPAIS